jgi:hypothetical protein
MIPSPQVAIDQRRSCTKLNLVGSFSSGVARNSKAGINDVKLDVNGLSPKDPAMFSMRVVGDNGLGRFCYMLRKRAKPSSALCMAIEFTIPACRSEYMFERQTTEPRRTAQAMALGVTALATSAREMSGGAIVG